VVHPFDAVPHSFDTASAPMEVFVPFAAVAAVSVETVSAPIEFFVPSVAVAAAPAETVAAPIEVFAGSDEVSSAPIGVFSPPARGFDFVAFVDWMAISIHNMNRGEKYYDSSATFHDVGIVQNRALSDAFLSNVYPSQERVFHYHTNVHGDNGVRLSRKPDLQIR